MLAAQTTAAAVAAPGDEAFEAAQWAMLSSAGQALRQMGLRAAAGTPELAARVRQRQDLADRATTLDAALAAEADLGRRIALRGEIDSLLLEIAAVDEALAEDFPRFAELSNPSPMTLAEVQALLRPDERLLLLLAGRDHVFVWAVGPDIVDVHRTMLGAASLAGDVAALRRQLDPHAASRGAESLLPGPGGPRVPAFDRTLALLLYRELLAPVAQVLEGARHLYVVGDGPLSGLPLSLLVTDPPEGEDTDPASLRATAWLARRHAVTTLPDVGSLRVVRGGPAPAPGKTRFVGFGDPVLGGRRVEAAVGSAASGQTFFRGVFADVEAVRNLPALPQTGPELRRLAEMLGGDGAVLHLGAEATEATVRSADLSQAEVLAFATHGLLSGELAGLAEPALVLTPPDAATPEDDGLLTASEIAALKLSAGWVLLSACNTAGSDGTPDAEGLSGLARAFLHAGARSVLVSHWPVRDDAAAMLTTGAIARMRTGEARGRAEALRLAMLDVMNDERDPSLAHPSAWAPFVIVGEGGE